MFTEKYLDAIEKRIEKKYPELTPEIISIIRSITNDAINAAQCELIIVHDRNKHSSPDEISRALLAAKLKPTFLSMPQILQDVELNKKEEKTDG